MKRFLNISSSGSWLMPQDKLLSFIDSYKAMVDSQDFSKISQEEIEKHINNHIPIKLVDTSSLDKQAISDIYTENLGNSSTGKVAVIELFGSFFTRWDFYIWYYGGVGMDYVSLILDALENDSQIEGVVLHIDSNGGELAGTELLGRRIAKFSKPIVAYCDNATHSAAYWIASQCDEIYSASNTTYMGSIGVMMRHINREEQYKTYGMEVTYVTAPQSTKKIKAPDNQALSDSDLADLKEILRQDAQVFINEVKKGRGDKIDIEAVSNADIFISSKAKSLGLHDGLATNGIIDTVKRVYKLASDSKSSSNKSVENNLEKKSDMKFENIKIEGKDLAVIAVAKNQKLILVEIAQMNALNEKFKGVELGDVEKEALSEIKTTFAGLGISGQKASVINILGSSKKAFVLVDCEELAGLESSLVKAEASSDSETEEVVTEEKEETEEVVTETEEKEVVAETETEEKEETEEVMTETEEKEVVAANASFDAQSNISPEIQAMIASMNERIDKISSEKDLLKQALEDSEKEKTVAISEKEKIIERAEALQTKLGAGKVITQKPVGDSDEPISYDLGSDKSSRADIAAMTAINILKERNLNSDKEIYKPENTMTI